MDYSNNHYIPQFILRRFGNKINRFNVETGDIRIKGSTKNAFSANKIYPEWLELMLGSLESKIANLIDNKILNTEDDVVLTRDEIWLIKKFFAVATLRVPNSSLFSVRHLDSEEKLRNMGFKETHIDNETNEEYVYRTLRVIIESNNIDEFINHPLITYEACKWMYLYNNCYLSIWDSTEIKEDFIITDNGMNCEHDRTRFLSFNFDRKIYKNEKDEMLKAGFILKKLEESQNDLAKKYAYGQIYNLMKYVHANYYLFAVSNTRTISLINPFYRMYDDPNHLTMVGNAIPDVWPTLLTRETMKCNTQSKKKEYEYNSDDLFFYPIKTLSIEEVIIINCMMLDRVYKWMGFDESSKIARSLNVYSMINKAFQRKHYDKLIEYIYSMGYEFPKKQPLLEIKNKLTTPIFTKQEISYIKFFYNLITQH